jgi:hypothetical protein
MHLSLVFNIGMVRNLEIEIAMWYSKHARFLYLFIIYFLVFSTSMPRLDFDK